MTVRLFNPRKDDHPDRCTIGRHKLGDGEYLLFLVDESRGICARHVLEITAAMDAFYRDKLTDARVLDVYQRVWKTQRYEENVDGLRRVAGTRDPGFVYYIRMDDLIKIGYAKDVRQRMRAYPPTAELLAVHPGTKETEREMHLQFRAFLRRGREWFAPHEKVMAHIDDVRSQFGDATRFAYRFRKVG